MRLVEIGGQWFDPESICHVRENPMGQGTKVTFHNGKDAVLSKVWPHDFMAGLTSENRHEVNA